MQFPSLNARIAKCNYQLASHAAGYFHLGIARSIRADIVNKLRLEKLLVPVGNDHLHAFPLCNALAGAFTNSTVKAYSVDSFAGPFKRRFVRDEKCVISLINFVNKVFQLYNLYHRSICAF